MHIGKDMVTTAGTQVREVSLGVALVFATQGIREGHVLNQACLYGVRQVEDGIAFFHADGIDDRQCHIVERLCAAYAQVEDA